MTAKLLGRNAKCALLYFVDELLIESDREHWLSEYWKVIGVSRA